MSTAPAANTTPATPIQSARFPAKKSEDGVTSRTLKDYDGTSRFVISKEIPSAGWTLSYAMDSSEHYKDAHNIIIFLWSVFP